MLVARIFAVGWKFACVSLLLTLAASCTLAASPNVKGLLDAGRVDELVQLLQAQLAAAPKDAAAYNYLCRAYFMMEDWDKGAPLCERAVELDAQNSSYELWLGRIEGEKADQASILSAAGIARKARLAFERAVELDPKNVEARVDLGEFYAEAPGIIGGGKDKARQQAEAIQSIDPALGHWVLARIAEKEKDPGAAEREYRVEIAASRSGVRGWTDLANFFLYAHRYEDMLDALRHAETAPIDHPESLMHAGNLILRANRDYPLGVRLLRRYFANGTVEEGPAFKAHAILGELLEKQGERQAAAQEFRAALALFQNYSRAKEGLGRLQH